MKLRKLIFEEDRVAVSNEKARKRVDIMMQAIKVYTPDIDERALRFGVSAGFTEIAFSDAKLDEAENEDPLTEKFKGIKGVNISYTDRGTFYATYLYDVPKTANIQWKEKLRSIEETNRFLKAIGINLQIDSRYRPEQLDQVVADLESKGYVADHDDVMDVT